MRTKTEVMAELEGVGAPKSRWGNFALVKVSLETLRQWRAENPEKSRRHDELLLELEAVEEHEMEMRALTLAIKHLQKAGVGDRTREVASTADESPAVLATKAWLAARNTWLLLAGDVGTGKSVAAVWALLEMAKTGQTVAFRRAAEVARLSGFDVGAAELSRLKKVGLLVVDDLGTECATGWGTSILHELFDTRHEGKLRTILTSNLKRADARTRLGDRLSDRVQQDGRVVWLEGGSMRREKREPGQEG